MNKLTTWFNRFGAVTKVAIVSGIAIASIGVMGVAAQPNTSTQNKVDRLPTSTVQSTQPKVEVKTETKTEPIPYTSSTIEDSSIARGQSQTHITGVNGVLTHTTQVTYTNGIESSRSGSIDYITTEAVNEVISKGIKIDCPNGTYVNDAGNTVCSPYTSSSTPGGATAQCRDGSYSFSQSRSGTCSHHGGVSVWL